MCSPALAVPALQIGSQMMNYQGQRQQVQAYNQAAKQNKVSATRNLNNQTIQNNMQREDARVNAMNQATDNLIATEQAKATANVSAAESGGTGQSLDQLIQGYNYNKDVAQGRIKANMNGQLNQANVNQAGYQASYQSTLANNQYKAKPDALTGFILPAANSMMQYMI